MKYSSTNDHRSRYSLEEAVALGLAPDGGLFLPERIPILPREFFEAIKTGKFNDIALAVATALMGDDIDAKELKRIIQKAYSFDAPVVEIEKDLYALELFHGPTMAFKDFGARFMSQLLGYFAKKAAKPVTILAATSGDTGGAVAHGFLGVPHTRVLILYPSGMVSEIQEKQFTTTGKNIEAVEVKGTFDDCQKLVKQAFSDADLRARVTLTSANSINIARLIPQTFYYFSAFAQLVKYGKPLVFSVPSGNLGNLTAGLLARRMGLPVHHFVAATNLNNTFVEFLQTRRYRPRPSVATVSNAMDVGDPSNLARILSLYQDNMESLIADVSGFSFTDKETTKAMQRLFVKTGYVMDPHGAVGYLGLKKFLGKRRDLLGVFLETAHPGKFRSVVEGALKDSLELPSKLLQLLEKEKRSIPIENDYKALKGIILGS